MANQRLCSIPGCGKPYNARGLCRTHYQKARVEMQPLCSVAGCGRRSAVRGRCDKHYRQILPVEGRLEVIQRGCAVAGCKRPHGSLGYCEPHYARFKRHGDPLAGISDKGAGLAFIESVLSRAPTDECILWHAPFLGKSSRSTYARVQVDGRGWPAHRYVCHRAHGPEPSPGMEVCHSCANKRCVNPKHLRWGTEADNGADRSEHGTVSRGEAHWGCKLTEANVRAIRAASAATSDRSLAERFGVTKENIHFVRLGKTWRHVT